MMEVNKNMNEVKEPNEATSRAIGEAVEIIEHRTRFHPPEQGGMTMAEIAEIDKRTDYWFAPAGLNRGAPSVEAQKKKVFNAESHHEGGGYRESTFAEVEKARQRRVVSGMVEVELTRPDAFLIVKETLTRIGVASEGQNKLHQSCHILHKAGKYYITHFKLLFELDGKPSNIDQLDRARQNTIALLLESWGLVKLLQTVDRADTVPMKTIKIVPASEKRNWELISKHRIGKK